MIFVLNHMLDPDALYSKTYACMILFPDYIRDLPNKIEFFWCDQRKKVLTYYHNNTTLDFTLNGFNERLHVNSYFIVG